MEEEAKNLSKACLIVLASLSYSYFMASKVPKGMFRFFSLLPIFHLFTLVPLSVSRPIPSVILGGFITWLANFKLILYSFNLGPLSTNDSQRSFLKFIFLAVFPIKIKEKSGGQSKVTRRSNVDHNDTNSATATKDQDVRNTTSSGQTSSVTSSIQKSDFETESAKVIPLNFWSKALLFIFLDVVYHHTKNMVVFCCLMYLFIDIAFGLCNFLAKTILGLELEPPSDEPYMSTSLQDFWGRRWNRMISDSLRHTIYKPVRSTARKLMGPKWAPMPAVMASFLVSGLMHDLIFYYMTRACPTWEVTWFFVLHGVCVILEIAIKRNLGHRWKLHWVVSGPLTVGFVMATGFWLFFPQIMRNHVDTEATEDLLALGKYLKEMVKTQNELT